MSQRGRHYYDPITQPPLAEGEQRDVSRIEVFQDPADPTLRRWCARHVLSDGRVDPEGIEDTDRDRVIAMAQSAWPELDVYELQDPGEDSTWEGMGPSPRLWQSGLEFSSAEREILHAANVTPASEVHYPAEEKQIPLRVIVASEPGTYLLIDDVIQLLDGWAVQYDEDKNPSGAMALREAAQTLREI